MEINSREFQNVLLKYIWTPSNVWAWKNLSDVLFCLSGAGCQKRKYTSIFLLKRGDPSCLQSKEGHVSFWFFSKVKLKEMAMAILLLHSWFQKKACSWKKKMVEISSSAHSKAVCCISSSPGITKNWCGVPIPVIGEIHGFNDADLVHGHRIIKVRWLWMTGGARPMALLPLPGGSRVQDVPKTITICFLSCSWLLIALTLALH